mmetsp:Transcript_20277/g.42485  ORF Transcript_20277/g.42485 Transcript_20277/m.42485 type:complete len:228 (+) Transcript_20277:729-1412(+)
MPLVTLVGRLMPFSCCCNGACTLVGVTSVEYSASWASSAPSSPNSSTSSPRLLLRWLLPSLPSSPPVSSLTLETLSLGSPAATSIFFISASTASCTSIPSPSMFVAAMIMFSTLVKLARLNFLLSFVVETPLNTRVDPVSLPTCNDLSESLPDASVPDGLLKLLTLTFPPRPSPSPPFLTNPGLGWGMWAVGAGAGGVSGGTGGTKLMLSTLCLGGVLSGGGGGWVL